MDEKKEKDSKPTMAAVVDWYTCHLRSGPEGSEPDVEVVAYLIGLNGEKEPSAAVSLVTFDSSVPGVRLERLESHGVLGVFERRTCTRLRAMLPGEPRNDREDLAPFHEVRGAESGDLDRRDIDAIRELLDSKEPFELKPTDTDKSLLYGFGLKPPTRAERAVGAVADILKVAVILDQAHRAMAEADKAMAEATPASTEKKP